MAITLTEAPTQGVSETTRQRTLDIINQRMQLPPGTINYARITSWRNHRDDPSFTVLLDFWLNDDHYALMPMAPLKSHEFGSNLRYPEDFQAMAEGDDRDLLYRHVEYIIHFQDAQRRQESDPSFDAAKEEAVLQALETELGIVSTFRLDVAESTEEQTINPDEEPTE